MNQRVRVVVANQPRLMRELVLETVGQQPDIEVLAEIEDESEIARVVNQSTPDFLIITLDEADKYPPVCDDLLRRHPEMKILALAAERNSSMFFWASFNVNAVPVEASEAGILSTLRGKCSPVGG
jgi:DNA-binding NarL/FixJ family response regulator